MHISKIIVSILSLTISKLAFASFYIPSANVPSGYDRISTADGTTCEASITPEMYLQTGMYTTVTDDKYDTENSDQYKSINNRTDSDDSGVYVQLVIPLGKKQERLNCNRLYDLEIKRLKAELNKLKIEAQLKDVWEDPIYKN
ncbi:hypothetical protein BH581_03560 [Vibrio splendidus]|uniref:hypothetical protein n=1 Tax=Vibrio splendidus TaxID=29497 RepID=UPI0009787898|nr:hypothetical protein [Vibrio splendidus]OMO21319.1 hypothetical protein BH581_03560 [Vibrio splendidus]